jgi:phosphoglycerate dehydrogenase-like enzyme
VKLILTTEVAADTEPHLPPDMQVVHVDEQGELDGDARDAEIFFRWWSPGYRIDKVLAISPAIRWVHTPSAGVDHILTPMLRERAIIVTNGAGVHDIPVAEFTLARIFDYAKRLRYLHSAQVAHQWTGAPLMLEMQEVAGATLLIIGMGGIGQAVAARAAALGMRVWGCRRVPDPLPDVERMVGADEWRSLLPDIDYLVLALPLTSETRHMIDAAALRMMHPNAYLVNIARGGLIDEAALITALREGWIGGAALDVFSSEPLPPDNPLWSFENAFVSPHCAWASPHMRQRSINLFLVNLASYLAGNPLQNVVNRNAGY